MDEWQRTGAWKTQSQLHLCEGHHNVGSKSGNLLHWSVSSFNFLPPIYTTRLYPNPSRAWGQIESMSKWHSSLRIFNNLFQFNTIIPQYLSHCISAMWSGAFKPFTKSAWSSKLIDYSFSGQQEKGFFLLYITLVWDLMSVMPSAKFPSAFGYNQCFQ